MSDVSRLTDSYQGNIEQQIAQRRAGRRKAVRHGGTLCSGCYDEPPMDGQRYGLNCHRKANSAWYQRRKAEIARLRDLEKQLLGQSDHG